MTEEEYEEFIETCKSQLEAIQPCQITFSLKHCGGA